MFKWQSKTEWGGKTEHSGGGEETQVGGGDNEEKAEEGELCKKQSKWTKHLN